jgi:DNA-binding response OmpR family regulator
MGTSTILVVDDERKIREVVRSYLEHEGYAVLEADTGTRAIEVATVASPDLVVLDLMLPDISGEEVARSIRSRSALPIIMLTAKASEDDRVQGLHIGADDYLVKPFSPRELVARVQAVLRRSGNGSEEALRFDDGTLVIDRGSREVRCGGEPVELTRSEFDLLYSLASQAGRVLSRFELVAKVQGYDYAGYERTIDAHVKNLRRKIGEDPRNPRFILTVTGVGYKFAVKPDA